MFKLLADIQYGQAVKEKLKENKEKFDHLNEIDKRSTYCSISQISQIWREPPNKEEEAKLLYETNQMKHFKENIDDFETDFLFPLLPMCATEPIENSKINYERIRELDKLNESRDDTSVK